MDRVVEEIAEVRTFYWHFEDPANRRRFGGSAGQFRAGVVFGAAEFLGSLPPSPTEEELFFTVRRVGSVTAALHQLRPGDKFGVRGPTGTDSHEPVLRPESIVRSGGIGLIPLRSCLKLRPGQPGSLRQDPALLRGPRPQGPHVPRALREWEMSRGFECYSRWIGPTISGPATWAWSAAVSQAGVTVPVEKPPRSCADPRLCSGS